MRTFQFLMGLCLAGVSILLAANAAWPADESPLQAGEVGVFFDSAGTVRSENHVGSTSFDVYLVARVPAGGISAYELVDLKYPGTTAPLVSTSVLPSGSAFTKQVYADACSRAVATNSSSCPNAAGDIVPLIRYTLQYFGTDPVICLESFQCPTIAGNIPVDLYYESCDEPGVGKTLSLIVDPCLWLDGRVPIEGAHWGMLKSHFGQDR